MRIKPVRVKVYVDRVSNPGATRNVYPPIILSHVGDIAFWVYPNDRTDDLTDERGTYRYFYAAVSEGLADVLVAGSEDCVVADLIALDACDTKHRPKTETVTSSEAIARVLSKQARGEPLTQRDRDVLDPNSNEPGLTMTRTWREVMQLKGHEIIE